MWLRLPGCLVALGLLASCGVGVAQQPPAQDEGCMLRVEAKPPRSSSASTPVLEVWLADGTARQQTPAFFEVPCGQVQVRYAYRACAGTVQIEILPGAIAQIQIDGNTGDPARVELVTSRTALARVDEWRRRGQKRVGPWEEVPVLERTIDGKGRHHTTVEVPCGKTRSLRPWPEGERVPLKSLNVEAHSDQTTTVEVPENSGTTFTVVPFYTGVLQVVPTRSATAVRVGVTAHEPFTLPIETWGTAHRDCRGRSAGRLQEGPRLEDIEPYQRYALLDFCYGVKWLEMPEGTGLLSAGWPRDDPDKASSQALNLLTRGLRHKGRKARLSVGDTELGRVVWESHYDWEHDWNQGDDDELMTTALVVPAGHQRVRVEQDLCSFEVETEVPDAQHVFVSLQDPRQTTGTLLLVPHAHTETMEISGTEQVPGREWAAEEVEAARRSGQPLGVEASCGTRFLRTTWAMPEPPEGVQVITDHLAIETRTGETLRVQARGYARVHLLPPRGRMDAKVALDDATEQIGRHIAEPGTTLVLPSGTWEMTASHDDWAQDCEETFDLVAGSTTRVTPCAD